MPPKEKAEMAEYSRRYSFWKYQYTVRNEQFQREFDSLRNKVEQSPEWHVAKQAPEWKDSGLPPWVAFMSVEMRFGMRGELEEYERLLTMYGFDNTGPAAKAEDIIKKLAAGEPLVPHKLCGYKSPLRPPRGRGLYWEGDTPYATFEINLESPIKAILAQIEDAVSHYRAQAEHIKRIRTGERSDLDFRPPKTGDHADEVTFANLAIHSTSRSGSDASRAIGLWLVDYIIATGVDSNAARRELEKSLGEHLGELGYFDWVDQSVNRFIRKTKESITRHEVMSFS